MSSYQCFHKEIRDPLYGYIHLTPLETRLIDTRVFQRLSWLLQNPGTAFVYPNATHTRKAHSLGAMHLAGEAVKKIIARQSSEDKQTLRTLLKPVTFIVGKDGKIEKEKNVQDLTNTGYSWWDDNLKKDPAFILEVVRIAALMHDIGHGPFSHIFEEAVKENVDENFKHEKMSIKLLRDIENYFKKSSPRLSEEEKGIIELACSILEKNKDKVPEFLIELIDGPVDVDKLDYINRDAYHAGPLEYGLLDHERILDGFRVMKNKLYYSASSIGAIARVFESLEYMYSNLYYHKTARAADLQLYDALKLNKTLLEEIISKPSEYVNWTDTLLLNKLEREGEGKSKKLISDLLSRNLKYKKKAEKRKVFTIVQDSYVDINKKIEEIEKKFENVSARVDSFKVKPIRLDLERIMNWLSSPFLISDGELKRIHEVDELLGQKINSFTFVVRLYVDRSQYDSEYANNAEKTFYELFV